jgi:hypothetical protein
MTNILTISEIESQFAGEWVLVVNPQIDDNLEVTAGRVLCHSKDRDEVYREAVAQRPTDFAIVFTGEPAPNTAIVL